jgi:hypothetical protein
MLLIWRHHGPLFDCKRTAALYRHEDGVNFVVSPALLATSQCHTLDFLGFGSSLKGQKSRECKMRCRMGSKLFHLIHIKLE